MNRRNGNWLAPSINQLTATPVTVRAALSGYRSIKALVCAKAAREGLAISGVVAQPNPRTRTGGATARRRGPYLRSKIKRRNSVSTQFEEVAKGRPIAGKDRDKANPSLGRFLNAQNRNLTHF
jgi:hypothetical protein